MAIHSPSKDQWAIALNLFSDMLESPDPPQFADSQTDPEIREALKTLWQRHQQAEAEGFLDEQITLVKDLGAPPNPALTFHPGQLLADRFAVLRVLGSGGMGEVYLADDRRLGETVALKTIKAELGRSPENRARFLDEVRRARQVTHPNVCRIFDVFDHHGASFYSMEYLAGATLAEVLAAGPMLAERAKQVAIQAADGLWTAHRNGILHCDFKPANIILTVSEKGERSVITDFGLALALSRSGIASESAVMAGTPSYMAPEVLKGSAPSIKSDVYAFGKVLGKLLPTHRLVARCTALDPNHRPPSMESVLQDLRGSSTRRTWMLGAGSTAAACIGAVYLWDQFQPKIALGSRQRVRVNGFAPNDTETSKSVRTLLMMALRQSPLLNVMGERGYLTADRTTVTKAGFALPLADLLQTARDQKANLVIDGRVEQSGERLKLLITVYALERDGVAYHTEVAVPDKRQIVHLAELAAAKLRTEAFGESAFHSGYRPLDQITSASTAAVDLYFRAVYQYQREDAQATLTLLDQAIAIDPDFVLAYQLKAATMGAQNLVESEQLWAQKAFDMRDRVTERERNWIESVYCNSVCDWSGQAASLRRNTLLFPDEAVFERQLGSALVRDTKYDEGIKHNRRSVELDPFGESNTSELLVNLAEANRMGEFKTAADQWQASGRPPDHSSLGLAALQQRDYAQALSHYQAVGAESSQWQSVSRLFMAVPLILTGRFEEAIASLEGDLAWDTAKPPDQRDQTSAYMRRAWLGELYRLKDQFGLAAQHAGFLVAVKPLGCNLVALREGTLLALDLQELRLAEQGVNKLSAVANRWPSPHSQGALSLAQALLAEWRGEPGSDTLLVKAKGTFTDPLNLYFIARAEGRAGHSEVQLTTLRQLDMLSGSVFKHYFAGRIVQGWIEQARCLEKMARLEESLRLYDRVAENWNTPQADGSLMRQVSRERIELKRRLA